MNKQKASNLSPMSTTPPINFWAVSTTRQLDSPAYISLPTPENEKYAKTSLVVKYTQLRFCIVPVELFHIENGDIRNTDGVKTICIWLHLVQGRVYSSLSPPSPPLSLPPSNVITRAAGLRTISAPPLPHTPPSGLGIDFGSLAQSRGWPPFWSL
jgi:hypothetical protein